MLLAFAEAVDWETFPDSASTKMLFPCGVGDHIKLFGSAGIVAFVNEDNSVVPLSGLVLVQAWPGHSTYCAHHSRWARLVG